MIPDALTIRKMEERDLEQAAKIETMCFSKPWSFALLEDSFQGP